MIEFMRHAIRRLRNPETLIFLLPVAALLYVFRKVIFEGRFFNDGDLIFQSLPYTHQIIGGHVVAQGILFGFPEYVSSVSGWFAIHNILFSFLPLISGYTLILAIYILLGYVFAYLYARRTGMRIEAATLAALVFIFAGQPLSSYFYSFAASYVFTLPASLYLFEIAFSARPVKRYLALLAAGAVLGLGWLSSHVQFVVYIHTFFFAYVVFRVWSERGLRAWSEALVALSVSNVASFLVGLPTILAILLFQSETLRASGVPAAPILTVDQMLEEPQTRDSGVLVGASHPRLPDYRSIGLPLTWDGVRPTVRRVPPLLGEHSSDVLTWLGYTLDDVRSLRGNGVIQ